MMNQSAEEYLLSIPTWAKQKNSFEDIRKVLEFLGCPDRDFSIIHVAGTNGKGSVCAFLTSMLVEGGYRTGTFTSPHLTDIRERFMIDGQPVSEEMFNGAFQAVYQAVETFKGTTSQNGQTYQSPPFFEFLFLMGMVIFKECGVKYIVLETGLGGRLDTTNAVCSPLVTVITSISMDHMEYLGDTLEKIAAEKAGIIKRDIPVVYDAGDPRTSAVIESKALEYSGKLYPVAKDQLPVRRQEDGFLTAEQDGIPYEIPFAGRYQAVNAMLAVKAIEAGNIALTRVQMQTGIRKTRWAGRMEQVLPGVYLDGAHNFGGIQAFTETVKEFQKDGNRTCYLLFAVVSDKEYRQMIKKLCIELSWAAIVTAHMDNKRSLDAETMEELFRSHTDRPVVGFHDVSDAVDYVLGLKKQEDLVFCVGSLYLIGEIKSELRRKYHDRF